MQQEDKKYPLISVIVPVYGVEAFLEECLDSIINQTWKNLDIILIDDGSPDNCGRICDSYAEQDKRIRVFHTENKGLSAARNLGIKEAEKTQSEYIIFVDSDDWLEDNMTEVLVFTALEANADVVGCGEYYEYPHKTVIRKTAGACYSGEEAAKAVIEDRINNHVMNKIWKKQCFAGICFPEGRVYEDIAINYKVFSECKCVVNLPNTLYHYRKRENSITQTRSLKNTLDLWLAYRERYEYYRAAAGSEGATEIIDACERKLVMAARKVWQMWFNVPRPERTRYRESVKAIALYIKSTVPLFGKKTWPLRLQVCSLLTRHATAVSKGLVWLLSGIRDVIFLNKNHYMKL